MTRNLNRVFSATLVLLNCSLPALASDVLTPAMFEPGKTSVASSLSCPDVAAEDESAMVYCELVVTPSGLLHEGSISCRALDKHQEFVKITPQALMPIRFTPASINGEATAVKVSLRVMHKQSQGKCSWLAVLNNGYQGQQYGPSYIAPQEVLEGDGFMRAYFHKVRKAYSARTLGQPGKPYVDAVTLKIDDSGNVDGIRFQPPTAKREIKRILRTSLKGTRFIPGQKDGAAISMDAMLLTGGESATKTLFSASGVTTFDNR